MIIIKSRPLFYTLCLLLMSCGIRFFLYSNPIPPDPEWRISRKIVTERLPADSEHEIFTPSQKPEYKNRIINHLLSIDESINGRIIVLSTGANPRQDYVFLDDSLCIVMYEWENLPQSTLDIMLGELGHRYGLPQTGEDNSLPSLSYRDTRSCVLLIKRPSGSKGTDVRLYLYPRNLFYYLLQH